MLTMKKQHEPAYGPKIRQKWYFLVDKVGKSVKEVCGLYAISRKTYYKWSGIDNGSRKHVPPQKQPKLKLTKQIKEFIEIEKFRLNYGPKKMKFLVKRRFGLDISTTIIYHFYKKKGLIRRPQKKLSWYTPLKEPVIPKGAGEVVQMDAKYVWQDNRRRYQRTFIDIWTGIQFATVTDTMTAEDTTNAFLEAERYFLFKILGVQSDNGSENRGDFHKYLGEKGVAHYFIPKSSPQWDGAVERAHGVIDQEFYLNPTRPWKTLEEYIHFYNYERIHLGKYLNGLIPYEKYLEWKISVTSRC